MKSSPDPAVLRQLARRLVLAALACATALIARADLPPWMQSSISGSAIEAELFRAMQLPAGRILYPRPPVEARIQLNSLIAATSTDAQLYALRAHVDEQSLNFPAAEHDWQAFVAHSPTPAAKTAAAFDLADFYHRRNEGPREIAALEAAAALPSAPDAKFLVSDRQQAWQAFPRALTVAQDEALGNAAIIAIYNAWITRYPSEPIIRTKLITVLLDMHRYNDAQRAIEAYEAAFPADRIFPIRAAALLAFDQDTPAATAAALALLDHAYQPLWPADLLSTYFEMLSATHTQHEMLTAVRAALLKNPDDLVAATKLFNYYQQAGHPDAAINSLSEYEASKDARHAAWSPDELYTLATLLDRSAQYQQAARYFFALAATPGHLSATPVSPQEAGLTGLIHILLTAPDQPINLGAGNLSIYRDLATTDNGPGYFNGVLSLWLNSQDPATEFANEQQKATSYFHRAKAASLLTVLDQQFPASSAAPELHAQLIAAYATYGQDAAVRQVGQQFLAKFADTPQRLQVALAVADADARANDTQAEFTLYYSLLAELSHKLQGMPLSAAVAVDAAPEAPMPDETPSPSSMAAPAPSASFLLRQSLTTPVKPSPFAADAAAYTQILDRYLGRLTITHQLPAALALLRRELDRNPDDPLLYERLADFLQQNDLTAQQEEVYQRAIGRFNSPTFYDKLARFYLRHKRQQDFDTLTRKVVDIFHGTELARYFSNVDSSWPQEYLQLNIYAHQRFPHDLTFTRNLLSAYQARATADPAAREQMLREHWQESPDLQSEFFELLSRTHQLSSELAALQALVPSAAQQQQDPAAARELAEIDLWQSHFEQSAPLLGELASQYPTDADLGDQAASVFRSLAYFDPAQIARAVGIEKNLAAAEPDSLGRFATIGDTYADSTAPSLNVDPQRQLAQAAPFWLHMSAVHPGLPSGYLQSATVFWDYFQFNDALAQINAARKQFHNTTLFGYQAGAIDESEGDIPGAVAEYTAAAISAEAGEGSDARGRLLQLDARPQFAGLIDSASANAVASHPSLAALQLRVDVLHASNRQDAIAPAVANAVARTTTADEAAQLAAFSQDHRLPSEYTSALQREIALANDPVQRIELQYQLARAFDSQANTAAAQRVIETVYSANPMLIGVVRSTVDFYWNNKQPQRAIATLVAASHQANSTLAHDFTLEAIDKANRSGDITRARALLKPLLAAEPFNAKYLALDAASFAAAHDAAGLRDFYTSTIAALKVAPLTVAEKRDKIALARQGLIVALTGLKDYTGAMDQHIALLSAFPEDDSTLQTAIAYARLHAIEPQLVAFLQQTVATSPRDSRFAIDLGRADLAFGDYASALDAYSKAIAIRADRPELYIARANLEEHQQAFDAACADYGRLYVLTYKDPQWMQAAALARARQGKPDLAAKALQAAWIDGRTATAADYFRVAKQLEQWDLLPQADTFAAQGVRLAGHDLLTLPEDRDGALSYARLLARERKAPEALAFFQGLRQVADDSPSSPAIILAQVEKTGLASVTDSDWRAHLAAARSRQAESTDRSALLEIASVVSTFYTPEEKSSFATILAGQRANRPAEEVAALWIPVAQTAGLKNLEAEWRRDLLLHGNPLANGQLRPFQSLEAQRMDYATLAATFDTLASRLKGDKQTSMLSRAADAWRDAGELQHEALDLRQLAVARGQQQDDRRLFELYLNGDPAALLQLTASDAGIADDAANFILANGTRSMAVSAVANRAEHRPPVWNSATTALVGLYFGDLSPATDAAFQTALANNPIGQRLQTKPNPDKQLIGNPWFYYATRYGVFLALSPQPVHDPEDYLPAQLEASPSDPGSYTSLAQIYRHDHNPAAAILEYRHVIELDPTSPTPDIAIAETEWDQHQSDAALGEFRQALAKLRTMVDLHSVPESFWTDFSTIAQDSANLNLGVQLRPAMTAVLAAYIHKNNDYRSFELLQSAFTAVQKQDPAAAAAEWVLSLISQANPYSQRSMLGDVAASLWYPKAQLGPLYLQEISLAQSAPADAPQTDAAISAPLTLARTSYIRWLLTNRRAAEAQRIFDAIPLQQRRRDDLQTLAILLAAQESTIPTMLSNYESSPSTAPPLATLSSAANTLRLQHDNTSSRLLLEYVFQQKLEQQTLTGADYLALAEARIATKDVTGALDLLHRLTFQGDLYANLDSASSLLLRTGHPAEAIPMLTELADATPWNAAYRLRLAQAQLALEQPAAANSLTSVASNGDALYAIRAEAATALHSLHTAAGKRLGSAELTLLAAASAPTPQQADQPFFVFARLTAASAAPARERAELLRAAILVTPAPLEDLLRLRIFQSNMEQARFAQAGVAISPVLSLNPSLRSPPTEPSITDADVSGREDATNEDAEIDTTTASDPYTPYTIVSALATPESQRRFALALALMDQHLDATSLAIEDLRTARRLTTVPAQRADLTQRIRALQNGLHRAAANAARRPSIQPSVEQTAHVRPRALNSQTSKLSTGSSALPTPPPAIQEAQP